MPGLTTKQLDHYNNKGYISPVNALSFSEAKEIREEIWFFQHLDIWIKDENLMANHTVDKNFVKHFLTNVFSLIFGTSDVEHWVVFVVVFC